MTDIVERLNDSLSAGYSELRKEAAEEIMRLRAEIGEMEKQEPVEWQSRTRPVWNDGMWTQWSKCSEGYAKDIMKASLVNDWLYEARPLYAIPVAQPAPSVSAELLDRAIDTIGRFCSDEGWMQSDMDTLDALIAASEAKP